MNRKFYESEKRRDAKQTIKTDAFIGDGIGLFLNQNYF